MRLGAAVVASCLLTVAASAGSTAIRFQQPDMTGVVGFRALIGLSPQQYTTEVALGMPPRQGELFVASVPIPDDVDVYVAIVAIDAFGQRSEASNEVARRASSAVSSLGRAGTPALEQPQ